jgi:hypothetical protein
MPFLDPNDHDLSQGPNGAGVFDRPSWLRSHILLVALVALSSLVFFAIFAINR